MRLHPDKPFYVLERRMNHGYRALVPEDEFIMLMSTDTDDFYPPLAIENRWDSVPTDFDGYKWVNDHLSTLAQEMELDSQLDVMEALAENVSRWDYNRGRYSDTIGFLCAVDLRSVLSNDEDGRWENFQIKGLDLSPVVEPPQKQKRKPWLL